MKKKLLMCYLRGKVVCKNALDHFFREDRGASDMVAIIVIIVIIIAVAAVFREQLIAAVTSAFEKLLEFIEA